MSTIQVKKISIVDLETDAIVNAANSGLMAGGGVCGAIFNAAGYHKLQEACNQIGHCATGSAVITPGFSLKAKYVIHAVGPIWNGGQYGEPEQLYGAYFRSLELAKENHCRSIGFPLISAGIFGYPAEGAWNQAIKACTDFLDKNPDADIDIIFAVLDDRNLETGNAKLRESSVAYKWLAESGMAMSMAAKKKDKLLLAGQEKDAVYFHLPDEPDGYLSNWFPSPFDLDGQHFTSVEQYIMYRKCLTFGDRISADAVLITDDTARQQQIGRNAAGYIDSVWAGMRQMVAIKGLLAKFSQNEALKQKLLNTGDAVLVECAGTDKVWACGIRLNDARRRDAANWTGQNILGFALMEVRSMLA